MDPRKEAICNALAAFIRQRPGFEYANYNSAAAYRADARRAGKDKAQAETLLAAVRWRDGITADDMIRAANGGRLTVGVQDDWRIAIAGRTRPEAWVTGFVSRADAETRIEEWRANGSAQAAKAHIHPPSGQVRIDYTAGQYWCVEFRAGVARYLAGLLWDWQRENMPQMGAAPVGSGKAEAGMYYDASAGRSLSAGDWLRRKFRQEFGSAMQKRWFD